MTLFAPFFQPLSGIAPVTTPELTVVVPCFNERQNVAPLVELLSETLGGIAWEVVFVDDDSPDGTADEARRIGRTDPRVRCIRRVGRRGLSSAVIEGALSSSALTVAVMDGDQQHEPSALRPMLEAIRSGDCDLIVGSRHLCQGDADGLASPWRHRLSELGTRLARRLLPVRLSDPMSGYFMLPRPLFEQLAPRLNGRGFKILLDLVLSAPMRLRVAEVRYSFHDRVAGESKLDIQVLLQFAGLLLDKLTGGLVPLRFASFCMVGTLGVLVHLAALSLVREALSFVHAQAVATIVAMVFNFYLNNLVTYRDQRLRGAPFWRGLILFMLVCGVGAVANVGIAGVLYRAHAAWTVAGALGAALGVVWNYAVSSTLVWRAR